MARDDWRWDLNRDRNEMDRDRRSGRDYEGYELRDRDWRNWEDRNRSMRPDRELGGTAHSYGEIGGGYGGYGRSGQSEREGMGSFDRERYGRDLQGGFGEGDRSFGGGYGERGYGGMGYGDRGMGGRYGMGGYGRGMGGYGRGMGHGMGAGYGRDMDRQFSRDWNAGGDIDRDRYYREWNRGERGRGREEEEGFFTRMGHSIRDMFTSEDRRGRGPKSYRRSEERIRDDIYDRLLSDPWADSHDVEVSVSGNEVTLSGFVPHRNDKRRIEDIAEEVLGVEEVHNQIKVRRGTTTEDTTTTTGRSRARRDDRTAQAK